MVNAVRTTARLKGLFAVALVAGLALSVKAVYDYRAGNLVVEGYRVGGVGEGIFGNPNEVALFLVTVAPVAVALALGSRSIVGKLFYAGSSLLMLAALVVTFSRGGFLGLAVALGLLAWKVGRRSRLGVAVLAVLCGVALLAAAPSNFTLRVLSIFVPSLDPVGSSDMRQQLLWASVWTAARHPLLGIGMGNFTLVSPRSLVSHNSYTQVASEMGLPALGVYLALLWTPYRGLSRIERAEHAGRRGSRHYYLAVGLQAALAGYAVSSFFSATAYTWYVYYLVGWCACLRRIYEGEVEAAALETGPRAGEEGAGEVG
jgi:O-antigen ligase